MNGIANNKRKIWATALLTAIALIYFYDLFNFSLRSRPGLFIHDYAGYYYGYYKIDPATILTSLSQGETDVFHPDERNVEDDVWGGPILYEFSTPWTQANFLMIADALSAHVWNDSLDEWGRLYDIGLTGSCQQIPNGFTGGGVTYFRTGLGAGGQVRYFTRLLVFEPETLSVAWAGDGIALHPLFGWKSIDLRKTRISAEDALKIADENGGRDIRLALKNNCYFSVILSPNQWRGWWIHYGPDFEMHVDPYTGEVIK